MKIENIEITHPDKIMFPSTNITKLTMIHYYEEVADKMLPFLKNRPLTLHRFPDGISSTGFYQKNAADYYPAFIKRVKIKTEEGYNEQFLCNTKKSLIYLANQGTIGFHVWLSKKDKIDMPDKIVFDLDPSTDSFSDLKSAAVIVRDFLKEKNIDPNLMTTGQSGLHVWYPIRRTKTFDDLRPEIKTMAQQLEDRHPKIFTTAVRKNQRDGKIFIDYLRNSYAQTSVCPYSLRPNEEGGIAMPLEWRDLEKLNSAKQFNLKDGNYNI